MEQDFHGGQPEVSFPDDRYNGYPEANYVEVLPEAKAGNKKGKKDKNDKSTKEKKPAAPIVPSFEGYVFTVADAIRPGEPVSWVRTHRAQMHLDSQELYAKAEKHRKESGLSPSGQFQVLGTNQRAIVNRLVDAKNAAEKEPNAVWTLFGVRKNYREQRSTFKTLRVNDSMRVTLRRGDKTKDVVHDLPGSRAEVDKANIVDLREPVVVKKDKESAPKDETEKKKNKKNKKQNPDNAVPVHPEFLPQFPDPFRNQQPEVVPESYPPYEEPRPRQAPHDPFSTFDMSGALPDGRIPVPPHHHQPEYPPEAPMAPQQPHYHQEPHPFQPVPGVFPQALPILDPFDGRQPRDPVAHGPQHTSARAPSHSRQRSHSRRRESVDSGRLRAREAQRIEDAVRDGVRGAMREVAADNKVLNHWPVNSGSGSGGSSRSAGQEDFWSNSGSSGNRRFSYSTPGTSPDRGVGYDQERPTGQFHRRNSSSTRPYVDEGKRYYMDRERKHVIKPHNTYRDHGRDVRYPNDRRQNYDDYPSTHQRRSSRDRHYIDRPRVQRRVTDYPQALHDADFSRPGRSVDYELTRPYDREDRRPYVYEERRDRRGRVVPGIYR